MRKYMMVFAVVSLCGSLSAMEKTSAELAKMETEKIEAEALDNMVDVEILRLKNDEQVLRGLIQDILNKRNSGFMVLTKEQNLFVECCQRALGINDVAPEKLIMRRVAVILFTLGMAFIAYSTVDQDYFLRAACMFSVGMALFECSGYSAEVDKSEVGICRWYDALSRFLATMDANDWRTSRLFEAAKNVDLKKMVDELVGEFYRFKTIAILDEKFHQIRLPDGDAIQNLIAIAQAIKDDLYKK